MGASEKDSSTPARLECECYDCRKSCTPSAGPKCEVLLGWCWGCRPTPKAPAPNPGAGHPCPICNKANVWHEEHPDGAVPDSADDCPAYAELKKAVDNIQVSRDMAGAVSELTGRCDALEDAAVEDRKYLREWRVVCDEADRLSKHNQDRRLEELDNDVAALDDRLRSCDARQLDYYRRTAHRLEALESAKPATFEELTDVLVRLEALETRLEDYRRVVGRIEELEYQLFDIRESLGPAERCQPDPGEPASAGSAADQKLYDDGYLIDVRPPRADAAQRRILRLTRQVERMEPCAELGFGGGWRVSHHETTGFRRCWKLNGPGGYSAIHFEAAGAVLAWLNRRGS